MFTLELRQDPGDRAGGRRRLARLPAVPADAGADRRRRTSARRGRRRPPSPPIWSNACAAACSCPTAPSAAASSSASSAAPERRVLALTRRCAAVYRLRRNNDRVDPRELVAADRPPSFQDLILRLQRYWADQGCVILQPYDIEVGAGTFHPATTLRALGPEPWNAAYVQPSRRPTDGRYGENPNRLQHYYQFQVIMKPSPPDFQDLYLSSLYALGIDPGAARPALRRGRLGEPDAGCLGPGLGGLVRRHGGVAVHLLPAGRRLRLPAGLGRADLRPRAAGHVRPGGRERLRPRLQRPRRDLRRGVPAGRARIFGVQLRGRRHRAAVPPLRRRRAALRGDPGARACRCRPTTSASRPATCSTCWTRAA